MERLVGVGASPGIAIGVAHVLSSRIEIHERRIAAEQVETEISRFEQALAETDAQLARIQAQIAEREGDEHQYRILEAHRLMLSDVHLVERARRIIRDEQTGAEWAVRKALNQIQAVFERIEDPYFRDRKSDVALVGERLLRNLVGLGDSTSPEDAPKGSIAVAHELSPADAAQLGRAETLGFCTEGGGRTSHTAIVARALGLPYVVGVEGLSHRVWSGMTLVIDGFRGEVILDPDAAALRRYEARADVHRARAHRLAAIRDVRSQTSDGLPIHLAANIEMLEEIPIAVDLGAEEVGLFRTEFLYLERAELPSEDEQYAHAVAALKSVGERRVTFRTLDLGGDKLPPSVRIPSGTNPAMGLRSIRFSLRREDVFRTQLRALYRAGAVGNMQILFPLISGVAELRAAKSICAEVCDELSREGIPHGRNIPLGVMVETPVGGPHPRPPGRGMRFPQHRHERPHSVRAGRRPRGRARRVPVSPASPGDFAGPPRHGGGGGQARQAGGDVRRHGRRPDALLDPARSRVAEPLHGPAPGPTGEIDHSLHGRARGAAAPAASPHHVDGERDRRARLRHHGEAFSPRAHRRGRGAIGGVKISARVRPATLADWPAGRELLREGDELHAALAPNYFRAGEHTVLEWRSWLEDATAAVFVADAGEKPLAAGLVVVRMYDTPQAPTMVPRRRGHVEVVVVAARHRRCGVGQRLMDAAAAWARARGAVELVLTTWAGNEAADAFYRRLGYQPLSTVLSRPLR